MIMKSREEMQQIADEIGIKIKFDSENAGVTIIDKGNNPISHKNYDEVWTDFCKVLNIEEGEKT